MTVVDDGTPPLVVRGLSKRYGNVQALGGIDLEVHRRHITGLIGPNGAGKSTVIRTVTGFERPTGGTVTFREQPLTTLRPDAIARAGLRQVFQHPHVFEGMSVRANVMVGAHDRFGRRWSAGALGLPGALRTERAIRAAADAEIDFVGLTADADGEADGLPIGQERLMQIARALIAQPIVLLCDEPAAGLNEAETAELGEVLRRVRERGIGVLLIEHDMSLVMGLCDAIVVLNFGEVIATGTPAEVAADPVVVDAYLGTTTQHLAEPGAPAPAATEQGAPGC